MKESFEPTPHAEAPANNSALTAALVGVHPKVLSKYEAALQEAGISACSATDSRELSRILSGVALDVVIIQHGTSSGERSRIASLVREARPDAKVIALFFMAPKSLPEGVIALEVPDDPEGLAAGVRQALAGS